MPDLLPLLVITVAAFFAGGINALAGGGSFLTLPALVFAFGPALQRRLVARERRTGGVGGRIGIFGVCAYGGYFNGGMSIVMLAMFRLLGVYDLRITNGLKNLLSAVLTLIAVLVYAAGGLIAWVEILPMALAATLGGLVGARVGRVPALVILRNTIILVGAVTTSLFFLDW
jgi:uncharacterized membrane protein YfcA